MPIFTPDLGQAVMPGAKEVAQDTGLGPPYLQGIVHALHVNQDIGQGQDSDQGHDQGTDRIPGIDHVREDIGKRNAI